MFWNMSLTEALPGILIGLVVIAIFCVIAFNIAKKDNANLDALLAAVPDELKEALKSEPYQPMDNKGVMYSTRGLVASVETNDNKAKVHLIFYNNARNEFYDQTAKMTAEELNAKGYKAFDMIPCQMKYDKEMYIHYFKKII